MKANLDRSCEACGHADGVAQVLVTTEDRTIIGMWCPECVDEGLNNMKDVLKLGKIGMRMLAAQELKEMLAELDS